MSHGGAVLKPAPVGWVFLDATATTGTLYGGGAVMRWRMCSMATRSAISVVGVLDTVPVSPSGWSDLAEIRALGQRWLRQRTRRTGNSAFRADLEAGPVNGPVGRAASATGRPPGDEAGEQLDDLLLPGSGLVELAAHLGEPGVDALFELVEAGGGLLAKRVDRGSVRVHLHAEVGQVAVAGGREVTGGRGVGGHLLHAGLQRGEPGFDIGRGGHGRERTERPRACARVTTRRARAVVPPVAAAPTLPSTPAIDRPGAPRRSRDYS